MGWPAHSPLVPSAGAQSRPRGCCIGNVPAARASAHHRTKESSGCIEQYPWQPHLQLNCLRN
eukprot:6401541-Pyramimonas_sp.AAC.1